MALPTVQDLHDRAGNPDLTHWNAAENFTLMEAMLLTIGADPLDWMGAEIDNLRVANHPNWRNGALFLRSLKEGVCNGEIVCIDIYVKEYQDQWGNWNPERVDVLDLSPGKTEDIIETMTKISRKALHDWYRRKSLLRAPASAVAARRDSSPNRTVNEIQSVVIAGANQLLSLTGPTYLDKTHPLSPAELRAAHEAWHVVTDNAAAGMTGADIKAAIRKFLNAHDEYKIFSNDAKDRICTLVNWNKKGGPMKTPGQSPPQSSS